MTPHGRRFAFVVNALAGKELSGGRADAARMYTLLCDEELGQCDALSPPPLQDCESRARFQDALLSLIQRWEHQDQLILYFSGHGRLRHEKYTLVFGQKPAETYLPFESVAADLQAHGVTRAIIIIDACQSGAALRRGTKGAPTLDPPRLPELPQGIAVLTSCRETESSYELDDGSGSVFTHLLAEGIRTGLGGRPTDDGLIGPGDIVEYINDKLQQQAFASYPQSSVFGVYAADRQLWLAHNRSAKPDATMLGPTRTIDDLRLLYEVTERSRWPCKGATVDHLDQTLVQAFAESFASKTARNATGEPLARELGFYSALSASDLHQAAVLCFAREPHLFVPQARAVFTVGERSSQSFRREDVLGPLPEQVKRLFDLVQREVAKGHGHTDYSETEQLFLQVVREAVSNALTHRDYAAAQIVRVSVRFPVVEVFSPGRFPAGKTFESLLAGEHVSAPNDAAIALYMTSLLAFEGIGRGFSVFAEYVRRTDEAHLKCSTSSDSSYIKLQAGFPVPEDFPTLEYVNAPPEATPSPAGREQERMDSVPPIADRYVVLEKLGEGGRGAVYKAQDTLLDRPVAIKVLSLRYQPHELQARILREARILARLRHPGIVQIIDTGHFGDVFYIVMEHLEGRDLQRFLQEARNRGSREAAYYDEVARIVEFVATALAHVHHSGVIHRDIKPSNIFITDDGRVVLLDFSLGKWQHEESEAFPPSEAPISKVEGEGLTMDGTVMGTPAYMSPEQVMGQGVDARTDIYALGVVLYELLTHEKPFRERSALRLMAKRLEGPPPRPRSQAPEVPAELDEICMKALELRLEDRWRDAETMAAKLRAFATKQQPAERPPAKGLRAWVRRRLSKDEDA